MNRAHLFRWTREIPWQLQKGSTIKSQRHISDAGSGQLGAEALGNREVEKSYTQFSPVLCRFLVGLLKDESLAADALQATFAKLIQKGGGVEAEALKSWLFRVAYNEAMLIKRKAGAHHRKVENSAWAITANQRAKQTDGIQEAIRDENVTRVREALRLLPDEQRQIVKMRIYDGMKFREISENTGVPLGTVLSRMQLAFKKLKQFIPDECE